MTMSEEEVFDDIDDFGYYFDTDSELYLTNACQKMSDEENRMEKPRNSKMYEIMTKTIKRKVKKMDMKLYLVHAFYLISISVLSYNLWQSTQLKNSN